MPRPRKPIDWPAAVAAYAAGASVLALRAEHGVSTHHYSELLRRADEAGVPRRGHDPKRRKIRRDQWPEIVAKRRAGVRRYLVAAEYGVGPPTIRRIEFLMGV